MKLAYLTLAVVAVDLWQQVVDWIYLRWGQQVTPYAISRDGWFTFGTLDSGDLLGKRYWRWWRLKLPCYGYHYQAVNDEYAWSRLYIGWWKGKFRHGWQEVTQ
jgi:hypothetical protein